MNISSLGLIQRMGRNVVFYCLGIRTNVFAALLALFNVAQRLRARWFNTDSAANSIRKFGRMCSGEAYHWYIVIAQMLSCSYSDRRVGIEYVFIFAVKTRNAVQRGVSIYRQGVEILLNLV